MAHQGEKKISSYTTIVNTNISYSREDMLGRGTYGTVHRGIFEGKEVAIKKIQLDFSVKKKDSEVKNQLVASHKNVVQVLKADVQDSDFRFFYTIPFVFKVFLNFYYFTYI